MTLLALLCALASVPLRLPVDRTLHAVRWDAWGLEQGETDLHIRGDLMLQLGQPPKFSGVFEVEGYPFTLEETGGISSLWLLRGQWSDLWEGDLEYWSPPVDRHYLGQVYTDLSFRTVLIFLPYQGRWTGYAAPAADAEEARALFHSHIPETRKPQGGGEASSALPE